MNEEHFPMLEHDLHDDEPSTPGRGLNRRQFMGAMGATADAAAASDDTEVVFLSLSSIGRLTDPRDQAVLWRNIAHILAHRIAARF